MKQSAILSVQLTYRIAKKRLLFCNSVTEAAVAVLSSKVFNFTINEALKEKFQLGKRCGKKCDGNFIIAGEIRTV